MFTISIYPIFPLSFIPFQDSSQETQISLPLMIELHYTKKQVVTSKSVSFAQEMESGISNTKESTNPSSAIQPYLECRLQSRDNCTYP